MGKRSGRTKIALWLGGCFALGIAQGGSALGPRGTDSRELRDAVDMQIHLNPAQLFDQPAPRGLPSRIHPKLVRYYHERDMQPLWTAGDGPNPSAVILHEALAAAESHGLNPSDYYIGQIDRYWNAKDALSLARLELLLTLAITDFVSDMSGGRRRPREIDPELFPTARENDVDPVDLVQRCLACVDLKAFLEDQAPPFTQYRELRAKLAEYRALAAAGGWPQVRTGPVLKPGQNDPRIPEVRKRLAATGDCPAAGAVDDKAYDETLVAAVKDFQRRNGLVTDGLIGRATQAAMNVPAERRVRQIILNMESWRWVSRHPGDWYLVVNIPSFDLTAVNHDKVELTMPVIVGEEYNMTPVFSDSVRYVIFNPYWDVPLSIAQKEMLPKLQKDSSYLKKERIRLYEGRVEDAHEVDATAVDWSQVKPEDMTRYRLRQDTGPDNSLGTVGFIFPNAFNVYLHDTPAYTLFEQPKRTFSHGCIRVSRAQELAAYILGGTDKSWTVDRVRATIAEGKNQVVHLEASLPIFILYNTAVIDLESHELLFYEDVYGRDALLEKALF